jgi:hypothetical protein
MNKPIEDKPHELQIQRIPFFPWSPERINGDTHSIMDTIKTLQDTINKRENLVNNILENSANGGAAIDPEIVGNDPDMKQKIQENWSNPKFKFWSQPGAIAAGRNYFAQIPKTNPPSEVFAQINHLWDALDRVLPVSAASDGRSESASESGVLYSMKQQSIEIAQTTLVRSLMGILTEMGDAYFRAARKYYSNVERTFTDSKGKSFKINEIVPMPNNDLGMLNDISNLSNLRTLVKMGQDSPNTRFSRRLTALDMLKLIPPTMPMIQVEVISELIDTLDLGDDTKVKMKNAIEETRKDSATVQAANSSIAQDNATMSGLNVQKSQQPPPAPAVEQQAPSQPQQAGAPQPPAGAGDMNSFMQAIGPLLG